MRWAIVGAGIAVFLWSTEPFQRTFFPTRYKQAQAATAREVVAMDREMLRVAEKALRELKPGSGVGDLLEYEVRRDLLRKEIDVWRQALAYDQGV